MERMLLNFLSDVSGGIERTAPRFDLPPEEAHLRCVNCGKRKTSLFEGSPYGDDNKQWTCSFRCFHMAAEKQRRQEEKEKEKEKGEKKEEEKE